MAARTRSHPMDIDSTGVSTPDRLFINGSECCRSMVLLNSQITHRMARSSECGQQLRPVVLQCLSPLGVGGADGEDPSLERKRAAMGG